MSELVKGIMTASGPKKFDYQELANKPNMFSTVYVNNKEVSATKEDDHFALTSGTNIELKANASTNQIQIATTLTERNVANQAFQLVENSLISQDTLNSYGAESIDEILQELAPEIGDIRYTTRSNLSKEWLLCDASAVYEDDYPELYTMLSEKEPEVTKITTYDYDYYSFGGFTYLNGYYIYWINNNDNGSKIYYSRDINGPYLGGTYIKSGYEIASLQHQDGVYVALICLVGNSNWSHITTTTDITGSWTDSINIGTSGTVNYLTYFDGTWVALKAHSSNNYVRIYTSTNPSESWTMVTEVEDTYFDSIVYANGVYIGYDNNTNTNNSIYITTDLTSGVWTKKPIATDATYLCDLKYVDGHWEICSRTTNTIYTATDVLDTWNAEPVPIADFGVYKVDYVCGTQVLHGYITSGNSTTSGHIYIKNVDGGYDLIEKRMNNSINNNTIIDDKGRYCILGCVGSYDIGYIRAYVNTKPLPNIEVDGARAYIKAE